MFFGRSCVFLVLPLDSSLESRFLSIRGCRVSTFGDDVDVDVDLKMTFSLKFVVKIVAKSAVALFLVPNS